MQIISTKSDNRWKWRRSNLIAYFIQKECDFKLIENNTQLSLEVNVEIISKAFLGNHLSLFYLDVFEEAMKLNVVKLTSKIYLFDEHEGHEFPKWVYN